MPSKVPPQWSSKWFSNSTVHLNYLENLLKQDCCLGEISLPAQIYSGLEISQVNLKEKARPRLEHRFPLSWAVFWWLHQGPGGSAPGESW